jgi:hypothetical protein
MKLNTIKHFIALFAMCLFALGTSMASPPAGTDMALTSHPARHGESNSPVGCKQTEVSNFHVSGQTINKGRLNMKLNITKGGKSLAPKIYIYGREGIGKTTFLTSCPHPLIIDFDGGAERYNVDVLKVSSTSELLDVLLALQSVSHWSMIRCKSAGSSEIPAVSPTAEFVDCCKQLQTKGLWIWMQVLPSLLWTFSGISEMPKISLQNLAIVG